MNETIAGPGTDLVTAAERVRVYLNNTRAANTYKAYAADWRDFEAWCAAHRLSPIPTAPQTVMLYLSDLGGAGKKASTIGRRLAALAHVHRYAGYERPSGSRGVRELLAGMRRMHGTDAHGKEALLADDLRAIVRGL